MRVEREIISMIEIVEERALAKFGCICEIYLNKCMLVICIYIKVFDFNLVNVQTGYFKWDTTFSHDCPQKNHPKIFDFTYECLGHQCVEDSPCEVLGTKNECPNGVCYEG